MHSSLTLSTEDGVSLEAEIARADRARARAVLCHPHPQFGGTMRSVVISALFAALPDAGVTCLRFNFRGVEGSGGTYGDGISEAADVRAAVGSIADGADATTPLLLTGWSFGADVALSVTDDHVAGWLAIAPPLRFGESRESVAHDPRPKWLVLAEHDEFQPPDVVQEATKSWAATEATVITGASHFFIGRTDHVVAAALAAVDAL